MTDADKSPEFALAPLSWGSKALILAGGASVAIAISGVSAVLPKIEAALATTPQDKFLIKMLVGVVGAAMVIGAPLTGFLVDRLGLRRVFFWNYLVFAVAGTAGIYLSNLPALVVSRFLFGIAAAGAVTASIIAINKLIAPSRRAHWMGGYIAMAHISSLALLPLAGILAELDWRYAFAIYLFGAPFAVVALIAFRANEGRSSTEDAVKRRASEALFRWFPIPLALIGLVMGCITYLQVIYAPFLLRDMGIGPKLISFALVGDTLTGMLMALMFGKSRRYISANAAFVIAFSATGLGGIVIALASSYIWVVIGLAVTGFGIGWLMPNLMVVVSDRVKPHQQGRAAGLVKGANYLSPLVCIIATEWLSQVYGPRIPILISTGLSFGLVALLVYQMILTSKSGSDNNRAGLSIETPEI